MGESARNVNGLDARSLFDARRRLGCCTPLALATESVNIKRIDERLVLVFLGLLHRLAELLFEDALAVFQRAEFLLEDLLALLFLFVQPLEHLVERGYGL